MVKMLLEAGTALDVPLYGCADARSTPHLAVPASTDVFEYG